jgi:aminopeptidase-like protein
MASAFSMNHLPAEPANQADPISPGATDPELGAALYQVVTDLYPLCRSITGDGFRQSLERLARIVPLQSIEVPTGTPVFDWTIPREWNIRDAWIQPVGGNERIVDFRQHNLHVVGYSVPVDRRMTFAELRPYLHLHPERPDWIPYRTSYYQETWGFCVTRRQFERLEAAGGEFDVVIDSSLQPGHLTYGEYFKPGETNQEFLFSCHACHPSLANDNLSGMAVTAGLAQWLASRTTRYSYRFIWIPGTIGALAWLARNEERWGRIAMGLVVSCVGDPGAFTYKQSRRGDALIDRLAARSLMTSQVPHRIRRFSPLGYDERQYGSPGINLPVGCFLRTPNGEYPEYHSSADDLRLVTPEALAGSLRQLRSIVEAAEQGDDDAPAGSPSQVAGGNGSAEGPAPGADRRYLNLFPKGEPQLGRRGLYRSLGGGKGGRVEEACFWVLNFSDGEHHLGQIAERSGIEWDVVKEAAERLVAAGLLRAMA